MRGDALFSLKFSSTGKGPFMAGKAKKNVPKTHLLSWGEGVVE